MKFCPECGATLVTQKFCQECGANISKYTNSGAGDLGSFDFSAMENEAQKQLEKQKAMDDFCKAAEIKDKVLIKYNGTDENVFIPDEIKCIGEEAFAENKTVKSVVVSGSVEKIENWAFRNCEALEEVELRDGIKEIGWGAFYNTKLTTISLPKSISKITYGTFLEPVKKITVDEANPYFKSVDGVLYSKDMSTLVAIPRARRGHYAMPNEVDNVEEYVFQYSGITSISLSSRLTKIDDSLFCGSHISSITIPSNILCIGEYAFQNCQELISITIPGNVTTISDNAFSCCESLRSVTLSEGVVSLGNGAFFNCTSLTSVSLPDSLSSLGKGAFSQCKALTRITIPKGITVLKRSTFSGCHSLSEVTLQEGLTRIEEEAFRDCNLQSVKIPYSVLSIDKYAFPGGYVDLWHGIKFKMYVPSGRRYGLNSNDREFIDY